MSTKHTCRSAGNGDPIVFRSVDSLGTVERLSFWLTLLVRGNTNTTVKMSTVRSCSVRRTCGVESLRRKLHFVAKIEQATNSFSCYLHTFVGIKTAKRWPSVVIDVSKNAVFGSGFTHIANFWKIKCVL